jgi:hypothetical protein
VKVGTTTFTRRFGWDLRKFDDIFPEDFFAFWQGLSGGRPKIMKKIKFSPGDLVIAVKQWIIDGVCTWEYCSDLKAFVLSAIHDRVGGFSVIPYHLIFYHFDLLDPSDVEESDGDSEKPMLEIATDDKLAITIALLDWIVLNPLKAAFDRHTAKQPQATSFAFKTGDRVRIAGASLHHGKEGDVVASGKKVRVKVDSQELRMKSADLVLLSQKSKTEPLAFESMLEREERERAAAESCDFCRGRRPGANKMSRCGGCLSRTYCSKTCQVKHWGQGHKHECAGLLAERRTAKARMELEEERLASDLFGDYTSEAFRDLSANIAASVSAISRDPLTWERA